MTEEYQLPPTDSSHKARFSAATLGLAISMGATSVLLPQQGDEVRATEPPASASTSLPVTASSRLYVVPAEEPLAHVARQHHLTLAGLARANNLNENAVLKSGQVLRLTDGEPSSMVVATSLPPVDAQSSNATSTEFADRQGAVSVAADPEIDVDQEALQENASLSSEDSEDSLAVVAVAASDREAMATLTSELKNLAAVERQTAASALTLGASVKPAPRPAATSVDAIAAAPDSVKFEAAGSIARSQDDGRVSEFDAEFEAAAADQPQQPAVIARAPRPSAAAPLEGQVSTLRAKLPSLTGTLGRAVSSEDGSADWRDTLGRIQRGEADVVDRPQVARPTDRHVVRSGETLSTIAERYGVSAQSLARVNEVSNPRALPIGRELEVPVASAPVARSTQADSAVAVTTSVRAAVPGVGARPLSVATSLNANPYLASLKSEVSSLRDRYQSVATGEAAEAVVAAAPEERDASRLASVDRPTVIRASAMPMGGARPAIVPITNEPPAASQETRVAIASPPLDAPENPRVQPLVGRTVSPELPGLSSAEAYIPGASRFEGYAWPARGILTSGYGWRWGRMHRGIDIAAPTGTPISASADGVVVFAGWNSGGFGNLVDIRHPDGSLTRYAHNSRIMVRNGQQVRQGQLISEMGSTGRSTGPHLHFEIHKKGKGAINPVVSLPKGGLRAAR